MKENKNPSAPYWSLDGFWLGARLILPLIPGMIAFAIAIGSTAADKGLSFTESMLMNALVYAGASQMVALGVWPEPLLRLGAVGASVLIEGAP